MSSTFDGLYHRSPCTASCSGRNSPSIPYRGQTFHVQQSAKLLKSRSTIKGIVRAAERCREENVEGTLEPRSLDRAISRQSQVAVSVSALQILSSIWSEPSSAAETLPIEFIANFLDKVEDLGPYGPLFFVGTVVSAEMLPLFPTQPLTIASGLLFGPFKGAACALLATGTAAVLAFQLSRRVGKSLAKKAAGKEVEETQSSGMLSRVEQAIDSGSFQQQVVAVTLLRLTPVVPFSASNYLLGATPLKFTAYLLGTFVGLSFWCTLFAAVGSAGREVFKSGTSLDVILDDLLGRAGNLTETAGIGMALLGLGTLGYYTYQRIGQENEAEENIDPHKHHKEKCKQT